MFKPLLIVLGEPYSVFSEIIFKTLKLKNKKNNLPIIFIGSSSLLSKQMGKLGYKFKINNLKGIKNIKTLYKRNFINILDVKFNYKNIFDKISTKSNNYIFKCFEIAINLLKTQKFLGLINGPISKKHLLKKKYFGITEFLTDKFSSKNTQMLIFNKNLSVSPITTHLPLKKVTKNINKKKIILNVTQIHNFYKKVLKREPRIGVLGINPHCETNEKLNEEKKIIEPAVKTLKKKKIKVKGPFSADTCFLKKNIEKFDVIIGMYHDQVLTPIKTIFNFNAINITIGLPFIRVSPDHGPNNQMLGKNLSSPDSLIYAINFFNSLYVKTSKKKSRPKFSY